MRVIRGDRNLEAMFEENAQYLYYWDHKQELDTDIQRRLDYAEQMRLNASLSPLQAKLQATPH